VSEQTTAAERYDEAMEWAERRYAIVTAPGARIHDYVPLKKFMREECISAISAAYKKGVIDGKRLRSANAD
jgi:hypothetical protein